MKRLRNFLSLNLPVHLPLFISGATLILVFGLLAMYVVLHPTSMVGSFFQTIDQRLGVVSITQDGSSVLVKRLEEKLYLEFDIKADDMPLAETYSKNLGVSTEWTRGVELVLDEVTLNQLEPFLPARATVTFDDKKLILSSKSHRFLKSALPKDTFSFATGSAELKVFRDENRLSVLINQPKELVVYATASGKLNLSRKIDSELFSLADKVATIDVSLMHMSLEGELVLK